MSSPLSPQETLDEIIKGLPLIYGEIITAYGIAIIPPEISNLVRSSCIRFAEACVPERKDPCYKPWSDPKDFIEDLSGIENEMRSRRASAWNAACDAMLDNIGKIKKKV